VDGGANRIVRPRRYRLPASVNGSQSGGGECTVIRRESIQDAHAPACSPSPTPSSRRCSAVPQRAPRLPRAHPPHLGWFDLGTFLQDSIGNLNLMIWLAVAVVVLSYLVPWHTPVGLRHRRLR